MGGNWLRSGALSNQDVIALVNDAFVPVWIDVRTTPLPSVAAVDRALSGMKVELDDERRIAEKHKGFFLMSLVTTSDGGILLNPEATDHPVGMLFEEGHFPYARVKPDEYLAMLRKALSYVAPNRP